MIKLAATPDQRSVITARERHLFLAAGRRWGKTTTVRNRILFKTLGTPGFKYWYITPYYAQGVKEWNLLTRNRVFAKRISQKKKQPFPYILLHNGSEIGFRSFHKPESIRSEGLDEVWIDEIQDIDPDGFWEVIRPLVSDTRGTIGASGQFRGYNWYYKGMYLPGIDPSVRNYMAWRFPTSSGLAFRSAAGQQDLIDAKTMLPKSVYDQEYDCIPSANEAAAFDPLDIDRCIEGEPSRRPRLGYSYIMGLDLGRVVDHTAIVVLERETGRVIWCQHWQRGVKHSSLALLAARVARRYNAMVVIDATGGATGGRKKPDAYLRFYRKAIPNAKARYFTKHTKAEMVHTLSIAIEQKQVLIPKAYEHNGVGVAASYEDSLIDELKKYEYEYKNGHYDYHAAKGAHDDYVAALLMAWWAKHANWSHHSSTAADLANVIP